MMRTQLANVRLYDIKNVQVLRGPQGMLFGKNASAGLINIVTNQPRLNDTEFFSHVQYARMNTANNGNAGMVSLGGNLPVGGEAALRLSGFYTHYDGFVN